MKAGAVERSRPVETLLALSPLLPPSLLPGKPWAAPAQDFRTADSASGPGPCTGGTVWGALESPHPFPFPTQGGDVLEFLPLLGPRPS